MIEANIGLSVGTAFLGGAASPSPPAIKEVWHCKRLNLTMFGITTAQPGYLRNLITVDSPHIETRSSSSVTVSRPSLSSSLKLTRT